MSRKPSHIPRRGFLKTTLGASAAVVASQTAPASTLGRDGAIAPGEQIESAVGEKNAAKMQIMTTPSGVRFGLLGPKPARPAPAFLVLANSLEGTLGDRYFLQGGTDLAQQGYLCISLDLPCHGQERRTDEPEGLNGWRYRLDRGENPFEEFTKRAINVLDYLVAAEYIDPQKIAVCGTSRGGFVALHLMAADSRLRCASLIAPLTELGVLEEFQAMQHPERAAAMSLMRLVDKLAGRAVWIVIGDQDDRVGTDHVIAFARKMTATARANKILSKVDLHVLPEPRGHTTPSGAVELNIQWIARQLQSGASSPDAPESQTEKMP